MLISRAMSSTQSSSLLPAHDLPHYNASCAELPKLPLRLRQSHGEQPLQPHPSPAGPFGRLAVQSPAHCKQDTYHSRITRNTFSFACLSGERLKLYLVNSLRSKCIPRYVKGRNIVMSMYYDNRLDPEVQRGHAENSVLVSDYIKILSAGRCAFWGAGDEENGMGPFHYRQEGMWNNIANIMMREFAESGLPVFRCTSLFSTVTLKSKGSGKDSIY